jgi:hypothetical protein
MSRGFEVFGMVVESLVLPARAPSHGIVFSLSWWDEAFNEHKPSFVGIHPDPFDPCGDDSPEVNKRRVRFKE